MDEWYGTFPLGVVFTALGICLMCTQIYRIYITFGVNELTLIRRAFFRKSTQVYRPGDLKNIFLSTQIPNKGYNHGYVFKIITTNHGTIIGFVKDTTSAYFTREEMDYFNKIVNAYIRQNLNNSS